MGLDCLVHDRDAVSLGVRGDGQRAEHMAGAQLGPQPPALLLEGLQKRCHDGVGRGYRWRRQDVLTFLLFASSPPTFPLPGRPCSPHHTPATARGTLAAARSIVQKSNPGRRTAVAPRGFRAVTWQSRKALPRDRISGHMPKGDTVKRYGAGRKSAYYLSRRVCTWLLSLSFLDCSSLAPR